MSLQHTDTDIEKLKINKFESVSDFQLAQSLGLIGEDEISFVDENVQPDWNQTDSTADDFIKNRPTLAIVATTGSYNDLSDLPDLDATLYESITYSELKSKADNSQLVKGKMYRITDYNTVVNQTDITSANHAFDLVVTAISANDLDNHASALLHDGDTYFSTAGANLKKWQIWYDIYNDRAKYQWAHATNGKGVIYRMIDEHDNDCPYDFKNILFTKANTYTAAYTFNKFADGDTANSDLSLNGSYCYNNVILSYISVGAKLSLNQIVFLNNSSTSYCYFNKFGYHCSDNTFQRQCYCNTFEDDCYGNSFETGAHHNVFGSSFKHNTFNANLSNNNFGSNCSDISLGSNCSNNNFGSNCSNISFGNYLINSVFLNRCKYITCQTTTGILSNYLNSIIVESNNQYIKLTGTGSDYLQNIYIAQGCSGTENAYTELTITRDLPYRTTVGRDSNGDIRIYNEDDPASASQAQSDYTQTDPTAPDFIKNAPLIRIYRNLTGAEAVTTSPYYGTRWDVADTSITGYVDGMVVCVKVPNNGLGHGTYGTALQINSLGYKPFVYDVNTAIGARYNVGSVVWAVYNSTQKATLYLGSGSQSITGCWQVMDNESLDCIKYNSAIMNTNHFGGKKLYINSIDNVFYRADKHFWVKITTHNKEVNGVTYPYKDTTKAITDDDYWVDSPVVSTLSNTYNLFEGQYNNGCTCPAGKYMKVHIQFEPFSNDWKPSTGTAYPVYANGDFFLSYYYTNGPGSVATLRMYDLYSSHKGWYNYNASAYNGKMSGGEGAAGYIERIQPYGISRTCLEFIIFGKDSGNTILTQIDYSQTRGSIDRMPVVTKFVNNDLYTNFAWYKHNETEQNEKTVEIAAESGLITSKDLKATNLTASKFVKTDSNKKLVSTDITATDVSGLANVATSGSYVDLSDLPDLDAILYESITYSELKSKADNSQLVKGRKYRITNYATTTTQANTSSAGHAFDLVVTAIDVNKLNCLASALLHNGDTYFSTASADLGRWQIWYDIENNTSKYAWADATNGKGVIYRMIDEWGNDCPYDFKNIQFKRKLTDGSLDLDNGTDSWVYTFNAWNSDDELSEDASVISWKNLIDDGRNSCLSNVIQPYTNPYIQDEVFLRLNDNVFLNVYSFDDEVYFECSYNVLKDNCFLNTFGNYCYSNTFGNHCHSNTFGNTCDYNTFEDDCSYNTFGNSCVSNKFGYNCDYNTFGNSCHSNTFGNTCDYNTFGNNCYSNTFGDDCQSNTFGNTCDYNTFGDDANHIWFGNSSGQYGDYCKYNTIGSGNKYIRIYNTGAASPSNYLQNIYVAESVNTSTPYIDISTITRNRSYRTTVGKETDGTLKIYNEDDSPFPSLTGNQNKFLSVNFNSTDIEWTEINVTPITNPEYDYIFGTIDGIFITALYIDDYPDEIIPDIEEEYDCSFYTHIQRICNDFEYAAQCGTNFFSPTTETMEYEGETYRIWKAFVKATDSNDLEAVDVYGLLQDSVDYSVLNSMSMENSINNRFSPFAAVFTMSESYDTNLGEQYTLVHVNSIGKYSKTMSSSHQPSFTSLYLEYYGTDGDGSIFTNMIDYNASTIQEFIEKVVQTSERSQTFEYSGDILQYEDSDYQIWSDIQTGFFGGLIPLDTTYQDIYPHTLEADSDNFYTPYCPFEYSWRADQGQVEIGGYDPVTSKWTTVIAIR